MDTKISIIKLCCSVYIAAPRYEHICQICFMFYKYSTYNFFYETKHLRKEFEDMKYDASKLANKLDNNITGYKHRKIIHFVDNEDIRLYVTYSNIVQYTFSGGTNLIALQQENNKVPTQI